MSVGVVRILGTVIAGLQLPFLTEADPDLLSEGSIDPLGLASLSERLAEKIAPWVTSRMARVRFVTAIAAGSVVTQDMSDFPSADGVTTPYLAFEWHVVEAFGRYRGLDRDAGYGVPGISKARSVAARSGHLDALSYLKAPKVFGFHGIYKRLARGMGVVDDELLLQERGDQLVRAWEAEQGLEGFADRKAHTPGGKLAARLARLTLDALRQGRVTERPTSHLWWRLVRIFRPDAIGDAEGRLLYGWLTDPAAPMRRELVQVIEAAGPFETEAEALRRIRPKASSDLAVRLDAIEAYEGLAEVLMTAFRHLRYASTSEGWIDPGTTASHPTMLRCVKLLPQALSRAQDRLAEVGYEADLDPLMSSFAAVSHPADLAEALLSHHTATQAEKPPGKRPWFESSSKGVIVRPPYRLEEPPELRGIYVHPYRVGAIRQFIEDLL